MQVVLFSYNSLTALIRGKIAEVKYQKDPSILKALWQFLQSISICSFLVAGILILNFSLKDVSRISSSTTAIWLSNQMNKECRYNFSINYEEGEFSSNFGEATNLQRELYFENGYTTGAPYMPYVIRTSNYSFEKTFSLNCSDNLCFDVSLITLSTFSNDWFFETLEIPLYTNRGIAAEFHTSENQDSIIYISDVMADAIISINSSDSIESYDDILNENYSVVLSDVTGTRTLKVANIYLTKTTGRLMDKPFPEYNPGKQLTNIIGPFCVTPDKYFFEKGPFALACAANSSRSTINMVAEKFASIAKRNNQSFREKFLSSDGNLISNEVPDNMLIPKYLNPDRVNIFLLVLSMSLLAAGLITPFIFTMKKLVSLTTYCAGFWMALVTFGIQELVFGLTNPGLDLLFVFNIAGNIALLVCILIFVILAIFVKTSRKCNN